MPLLAIWSNEVSFLLIFYLVLCIPSLLLHPPFTPHPSFLSSLHPLRSLSLSPPSFLLFLSSFSSPSLSPCISQLNAPRINFSNSERHHRETWSGFDQARDRETGRQGDRETWEAGERRREVMGQFSRTSCWCLGMTSPKPKPNERPGLDLDLDYHKPVAALIAVFIDPSSCLSTVNGGKKSTEANGMKWNNDFSLAICLRYEHVLENHANCKRRKKILKCHWEERPKSSVGRDSEMRVRGSGFGHGLGYLDFRSDIF